MLNEQWDKWRELQDRMQELEVFMKRHDDRRKTVQGIMDLLRYKPEEEK